MRKKILGPILAVSTIALLSACGPMISGSMNAATTEQDVISKTAEYFGTSPGNVQISNVKKNMLNTTYRARYRGTLYNCQVYYGNVSCEKPGG